MKNRQQIDGKSMKNRIKSIWEGWGVPRWPLTVVLGRQEGIRRRRGGIMGASWGLLGAVLWKKWVPRGSENGAKIVQKSISKPMEIYIPPGIGFSQNFQGFGMEKTSKMAAQIQHLGQGRSPKENQQNRYKYQ